MKWTIDSWQNYPIKQVPTYNDGNELKNVEDELSLRPPLVFAEEVRRLRRRLASVAEGKAFLLQGGDCAESFLEHNANNIRDSFKVILQMAAVLTYGSSLPVTELVDKYYGEVQELGGNRWDTSSLIKRFRK